MPGTPSTPNVSPPVTTRGNGPAPQGHGRPAGLEGLFAAIQQQQQSVKCSTHDCPQIQALPDLEIDPETDMKPPPPASPREEDLLAADTPLSAVSPDGLAHALSMLKQLEAEQGRPTNKAIRTIEAIEQNPHKNLISPQSAGQREAGKPTVTAESISLTEMPDTRNIQAPLLAGSARTDKTGISTTGLQASLTEVRSTENSALTRNALLETLTQLQPATKTDGSTGILKLDVPGHMQQPAWQQALAERVVFVASRQVREAELQVNPAELGPVNIRIESANDKTAIQMMAAQADTREALEAALPRLREMFSQQGMELIRAEVRQEQHGQPSAGQNPMPAQPSHGELPALEAATDIPVRRPAHSHDGILDLYA